MPQTYQVKRGDTLSGIAKRFGVPQSAVTGYRSGNPNLIFPGETLTIQTQPAQTPKPIQGPQTDIPQQQTPTITAENLRAIMRSGGWIQRESDIPIILGMAQDPSKRASVEQRYQQELQTIQQQTQQDRPVITGPRLGETGAIPAPGFEQEHLRRRQELLNIQEQVDAARKEAARIGQEAGTLLSSTTPRGDLRLLEPEQKTFAVADVELEQNPPPVDISPSISTAKTQAASLQAGTPTQQLLLDEMKRLQEQSAKQAEGLTSLLEEKPEPISAEEITKQAFANLGLPADFTRQQFNQLQVANSEIASLSSQLAELESREQQSLARIEQQAIPMENISNQQRQTMRDFTIQKAGIAAQIQAKEAYAASLRGDLQLVNSAVNQAVDLVLVKNNQEISDFRWMYDNYQDDFNALSREEQQAFNNLLNSLEKERDLARDDLRDKISLFLNNKVPLYNPIDLQSMSFEEAARFVSQNAPAPVVQEKPLGPTQFNIEAGILGLTPSQVQDVVNLTSPPQWFVQQLEQQAQQSLLPAVVQQAWQEAKDRVNSAINTGGGGGLSYDDF